MKISVLFGDANLRVERDQVPCENMQEPGFWGEHRMTLCPLPSLLYQKMSSEETTSMMIERIDMSIVQILATLIDRDMARNYF